MTSARRSETGASDGVCRGRTECFVRLVFGTAQPRTERLSGWGRQHRYTATGTGVGAGTGGSRHPNRPARATFALHSGHETRARSLSTVTAPIVDGSGRKGGRPHLLPCCCVVTSLLVGVLIRGRSDVRIGQI